MKPVPISRIRSLAARLALRQGRFEREGGGGPDGPRDAVGGASMPAAGGAEDSGGPSRSNTPSTSARTLRGRPSAFERREPGPGGGAGPDRLRPSGRTCSPTGRRARRAAAIHRARSRPETGVSDQRG